MGKHKTHQKVCRRLARIAGHVKSIGKMIDDGRSCTEVLHQMEAVVASLKTARKVFLKDHLIHCVIKSAGKGNSRYAVNQINSSLKEIL
ncbi:MAG: metal-sensing transcriptional repressor [Planctomycetes bacterium]|nr:metal-sensing transcriptional repressor [Planctomycetota bacterium]